MHDRPEDSVLFTFFNEIGIIEQLARTVLEQSLPDGLKISHFIVLNHFARLGDDKSPAQLARAVQVTRGAMTNTLRRLEARGLVEINADPQDGRGKRVRLTDRGLATRDAAIRAQTPVLEELSKQLGGAHFQRALPFLQRLRAYLDRRRDKPRIPMGSGAPDS